MPVFEERDYSEAYSSFFLPWVWLKLPSWLSLSVFMFYLPFWLPIMLRIMMLIWARNPALCCDLQEVANKKTTCPFFTSNYVLYGQTLKRKNALEFLNLAFTPYSILSGNAGMCAENVFPMFIGRQVIGCADMVSKEPIVWAPKSSSILKAEYVGWIFR